MTVITSLLYQEKTPGAKRTPKIKEVRAFVVQEDESGADYHRQPQDHWIVQEISNPMSGYPKYKHNRTTYVSIFLSDHIIIITHHIQIVGVSMHLDL